MHVVQEQEGNLSDRAGMLLDSVESRKQIAAESTDISHITDSAWAAALHINHCQKRRFFWSSPGGAVEIAGIGSMLEIDLADSLFYAYWASCCSLIYEQTGVQMPGLCILPPVSDRTATSGLVWIPEILLRSTEGTTTLCTVSINGRRPVDLKSLLRQINEAGPATNNICKPPKFQEKQIDTKSEWLSNIEYIKQSIAEGQVDKVVLSRRVRFEAVDGAWRPEVHLAWLQQVARDRIVFGIQPADASAIFLGATPETLFAVNDGNLTTHALAGTLPPGASLSDFQQSHKLAQEHQVVADSIAAELQAADMRPQLGRQAVVQSGSVSHLQTPIVAQVPGDFRPLDLVSRLHPTPAISGYPKQSAAEILQKIEPYSRGWFAAPVGWFSAEGDCHVAVAIRSLWLGPKRASALVGAGIVADSDPEAEWDETEAKLENMRAILRAGSHA